MENKSKKISFLSIIFIVLLIITLGLTYAFFNYTRTGSVNTIKVGRIAFNSTQDNTINLTNVFPTSTEDMDSTNSSTVTINIEGDTTYSDGIEYRVIIDQVSNTINDKEIPISFSVTATDLGDRSNDYYNDRGSTSNVYNLVESGFASDGELILIGYIKPDNVGVDGSIDITAYLDKDKIGISDTVSRIDNGNLIYGETKGEWIAGRTILTTTEWNSLQTSGISFKVKVEANEGIWIPEPKFNVIHNFVSTANSNWTNIRGSITSVEFSTNPIVPANAITSFDATDITSDGPVTVYTLDDGLGNNTVKVVICADGEIYAPRDFSAEFMSMTNLITFNGENLRIDNSDCINGLFALDANLIDLRGVSSWNTSNVTNSMLVFYNCEKLSDISELASWDISNVHYLDQMFYTCVSLQNVDFLANWNISNVWNLSHMFSGCTNLVNVNGLANWNVSNVKNMTNMFSGCTNLVNVNGLANWNVSNVTNMTNMFSDCDLLVNFSPLSKWNVSNVEYMQGMFLMGANKAKEGNPVIDFSSIANWNVSNVTNMASMFQNLNILSYKSFKNWNVSSVENFSNMFNQTSSSTVTTLEGLENWNVSSAVDMSYMFADNVSLNDASAINNWNINANIAFPGMFYRTSIHPEFTRVSGTWDSEGTFTPTV